MARWKAVNWTRYHSLLTCLAEKGHEIIVLQPPSVLSEETNFKEIETELPLGIKLIDIYVPNWFWCRKFPLDKLVKKGVYSIYSLRAARRMINHSQVDAIIAYNIPQYSFMKISGPVKIFDFADDYIAMLKQELGIFDNRYVLNIARRVLKNMIERSDLVLAVSNVLAGTLGGKASVLPNGVSLEKRTYAREHPLSLELQRPIIGFIGSFEYFIDFEVILCVAKRLPQMSFLLVGTGRDWKWVRDEVARRDLNNIHLTGGVPHQDVFRYIDQMDVCLNIFKKGPVADGACPIKLFEYLIMGKPVITTRLRELEYIDEDFMFYGDDAEEISKMVNLILGGSPEVNEKVRKGEKIAMERYTWSGIAGQFERCFYSAKDHRNL